MRPMGSGASFGFPRAGRALLSLIAVNVVAYVVELLLLRTDNSNVVRALTLVPKNVLDDGQLWQPLTYMWLHSPDQPSHLLWNMFYLYMFGAPLEEWWGSRRFVTAYFIFGLGGAALTLLTGLLASLDLFSSWAGAFYLGPHLGASGAVMGMTVAWGITFADRPMNMLFLGQMKAKTFLWVAVGIELLMALSFNPVSSTSHFGGMIAAYLLTTGLWRPSKWAARFRRRGLERKRHRLEKELRVIEGGRDLPKNPREWN